MGYKSGLERHINKHELPPPIDSALFYGDLLAFIEEASLSIEGYKQFYNDIFQFEDLDDTLLHDEMEEYGSDDEYDYESGFVVKDED